MRFKYLFTHYTADGYACLEDESGNSFYVPTEWLPEAAAPGASVRLSSRRSFDSSHLSVSVATSDKDTPVPPDTLTTSPPEP